VATLISAAVRFDPSALTPLFEGRFMNTPVFDLKALCQFDFPYTISQLGYIWFFWNPYGNLPSQQFFAAVTFRLAAGGLGRSNRIDGVCGFSGRIGAVCHNIKVYMLCTRLPGAWVAIYTLATHIKGPFSFESEYPRRHPLEVSRPQGCTTMDRVI